MTSTNKKILAVTTILVLGGIAAFYLTKERGNSVAKVDTTNIENATSTDSLNEQNNPNYTIDVVPVGQTPIPVPDLNRKVNFETADNNSKLKIEEISGKLTIDKNNLSLWVELGSYRKAIGDYEGARQAWEYVVAVSPTYIVPLINLGDLYQFYFKDNLKAEEYMKKVIALDKASVEGYFRLYNLYALSYKEKIAEAPKVLLQGLAVNPKSVDLMILLAEHYRSLNDRANATIYYDKAIAELNAIRDYARMSEIKNARDALN